MIILFFFISFTYNIFIVIIVLFTYFLILWSLLHFSNQIYIFKIWFFKCSLYFDLLFIIIISYSYHDSLIIFYLNFFLMNDLFCIFLFCKNLSTFSTFFNLSCFSLCLSHYVKFQFSCWAETRRWSKTFQSPRD
jgi:hypothetical protein